MRITTLVKMNHAQNALLDDFQNIMVEDSLDDKTIRVIIDTFTLQRVVLTVNETGVIEHVELEG